MTPTPNEAMIQNLNVLTTKKQRLFQCERRHNKAAGRNRTTSKNAKTEQNTTTTTECTPGSMNGLFSDFRREFRKGILGGVRDYLGEILGGFYTKNEGEVEDNYTRKKRKQQVILRNTSPHR